jgi:hypothetical protein
MEDTYKVKQHAINKSTFYSVYLSIPHTASQLAQDMSTFDNDLVNGKKLLDALGTEHLKHLDAHTLYKRLEENISNAELYGDTNDLAALRTQIRRGLDKVSLEVYKCTIDNLDKPASAPSVKSPSPHQQSEISKSTISIHGDDGKLVFISHSSVDKPFIDRLEKDLDKAGFQTWYDKKSIKVSQSIPGEINVGLKKCDYFIVVLTPDSVKATWVLKEIDAALMANKIIVPVLLKDCEIPSLIKATKYADFRTDYEKGLAAILDGLGVQREIVALPGLLFIFEIIERACYNGDLSPDQGQTLRNFFSSIAMKKHKGEKPMSPLNPENTGEIFAYSSQILAYHLMALSDYHATWQNMSLGDDQKNISIMLLHELQNHVLTSSALVETISKGTATKGTKSNAANIIKSLRSLKITLTDIDKYLYSGKIPYEVSDEIEKYFDDLVYYLSQFIAVLKELADSSSRKELVQ